MVVSQLLFILFFISAASLLFCPTLYDIFHGILCYVIAWRSLLHARLFVGLIPAQQGASVRLELKTLIILDEEMLN